MVDHRYYSSVRRYFLRPSPRDAGLWTPGLRTPTPGLKTALDFPSRIYTLVHIRAERRRPMPPRRNPRYHCALLAESESITSVRLAPDRQARFHDSRRLAPIPHTIFPAVTKPARKSHQRPVHATPHQLLCNFTSTTIFPTRFSLFTSATQQRPKKATQVKGVACLPVAHSPRTQNATS